MKLIISAFKQETNFFSKFQIDIQIFKSREFFEGDAIVFHHTKKGTEIGSFIEVAEEEDIELIPIVSAYAGT